ncbi:hypothetical protein [Streptosporangium sp. NPDC048865]|uniref:hypothetical protein n=1 Tax=Streptosporangium sp. NPDC048865 TaxID=3155766 RepID=UPI00343E118F
MFTSVWTPLGGKVADRWAGLLTSPVMVLWGGGLLAWVHGHGGLTGTGSGWKELERQWRTAFPEPAAQVALLVGALLVVLASARLLENLTLPVVRLLEGYWPRWAWPISAALTWMRGRRIERAARRWRDLALRRDELTARERLRFSRLDAGRAAVPAVPDLRMPTALGDLLRATELRIRLRYGLDAVACWPRLWILLPEQARADIGQARARLDEMARLWAVGVALAGFTILTWWALLAAAVVAAVAHRLLRSAAADYAIMLQSCFDLHRRMLYEAVDLPWETRAEPEGGQRITAFLTRGTALTVAGEG